MCGIAGIFHLDGCAADPELLSRMTRALSHRGPDGAGSLISSEIALGHRRLSIIDLEGGKQPIANEDDTIHVVFNGEIYNFVELRADLVSRGHTFRTRSDTEVIVHAYEEWQDECVTRFNGIFAFALWDSRGKRLLIGRDHLGVKPLYYTSQGNRLTFASEIKALLEASDFSREVDLAALADLFTVRYVPSPRTLFKGVFKLPPGHVLIATAKGIEIRRYWNWKASACRSASEDTLIEEYQFLVDDAVRLQMRSDVPVGLYLSSGIDSTALLERMTRHTDTKVHTFTIGFEGGELSNETEDARQIASRFSSDHTEMILGSRDYEQYYERYLWDLEEPVGHEPAVAFYFLSLLASEKVKVVLCGQGADEPWAGYHRYVGIHLSGAYSQLPVMVTRAIARYVDRFAHGERLRRGTQALAERDVLSRIVKVYSFYNSGMKSRLFQPWLKDAIGADEAITRESLARLQEDVKDLDALSQMLYIDTRASLPDDLLMVADKLSMANGVEARVPYLDHRIIEFVESLPPNLKLRRFRGKYLHKKALAPWVSQEVAYRPKKGFAHPIDQWLRGRMRGFVEDCLLSDNSRVQQFFEPAYIRTMVKEHEKGRQNYLRHLYLLISFELWHRRFMPG